MEIGTLNSSERLLVRTRPHSNMVPQADSSASSQRKVERNLATVRNALSRQPERPSSHKMLAAVSSGLGTSRLRCALGVAMTTTCLETKQPRISTSGVDRSGRSAQSPKSSAWAVEALAAQVGGGQSGWGLTAVRRRRDAATNMYA